METQCDSSAFKRGRRLCILIYDYVLHRQWSALVRASIWPNCLLDRRLHVFCVLDVLQLDRLEPRGVS